MNIKEGPPALAKSALDDGTFALATARQMYEHFVARPMVLDPNRTDNELVILEKLAADFRKSYGLKGLVKAIVELPHYRRLR